MRLGVNEKGDERVRVVEDLVAGLSGWDRGPLSLIHELREMLKSIIDHGTEIDSGGGDGMADLWAKVQGIEYYMTVRRSNAQLMKDGKPIPE